MMVKGIVITSFLIVLLHQKYLRAQSGRKIYFSRCLSSEPVMYLDRMSLQDCINACTGRNYCLSVSYNKVSQFCQLYDVITSLFPCTGFSVLLKRDFPVDNANSCFGMCPSSDCNSIPSIDNAETFGNMLDIGAVVKVKCLNDGSVSYIVCQTNGQWTQLPTCTAHVTAGSSCYVDADCTDIDGRCLYTSLSSLGSRCYCKALYEFNQTQSVCTQICASYTSLQRYNNAYTYRHNVGDSNGETLTEAECLKLCEDNYGDTYLSVEHGYTKTSGTNCYCGSVTRQQALDSSPELLKSSSNYNLFSRTCN